MLNSLRFAIRLLWRECLAGEWIIIFFALLFSVATVTALHFYTDRLMRGLDLQGATFLGGDLVVSSPTIIPVAWKQKANELSLKTADVWFYPTMASTDKKLQLVNVQAVSDNFPLIGKETIHPSTGTVWVEARVLSLLNVRLNNSLTIGNMNFRITRILPGDLATLSSGWLMAPRVMLNLKDIPATKTVLIGSRVDYQLLMIGNKNNLQSLKEWITPLLQPGQRLLDIHSQQFVLQNTLERTRQYLQLILLISLTMSGVAIALSIQYYLHRHYKYVALWRCLGMKKQQMIIIFLWQLLIVAISAGILGIIIGFLTQTFLAHLFSGFLQFQLPTAGFWPVILGFLTSLFLLFSFAYPIIKLLPNISPIYLWRNDIKQGSAYNFYFGSFLILLFFLYLFMGRSELTFIFMWSLFVSVALFYLLSLVILFLIRHSLNLTEGTLRRALSQLIQYPQMTSLQLMGFSLILMSILLLGYVRTHLINQWQATLPKNTPNYFAFNIGKNDLPALKKFFKKNKIIVDDLYPMVRGRLIGLNRQPIMSAIPRSAMNNNALHRELNLSWMWELPKNNMITEGKPWNSSSQNSVSVEKNLAENLNLHIHDELTFQVADQKFSAKITSIRTVDWQSFQPNFYMIFTPELLNHFVATYITSFYLTNHQVPVLNQLIEQFPNVTIIDVASLLLEVQNLLNKIILAIQYLFLFSLGAGILIFIITLQASLELRRQSYRLFRILGASQKYITQTIVIEFSLLACIIIFISIVIAELLGRLLVSYFF